MPPTLLYALSYVQRGMYVLPLYGVNPDRTCQCGDATCQSPGKHPHRDLVTHGLDGASRDEDVVHRWFARDPAPNIGIVTGEASGIVVVDIDPRSGGHISLEELEAKTYLGEPVVAKTGSGGWHYYYRHPIDQEIGSRPHALGTGLDVKARRGYVVAPPSGHVSGKSYEWQDDDAADEWVLPELPRGLIDLMKARRRRPTATNEEIGPGMRNVAMFDLACAMRRYGASFEAMSAALHEDNQARCVPLLMAAEIDGIVKRVLTYEPEAPLLLHPERVLQLWREGRERPEFCLSAIEYLGECEPPPEEEEWLIEGIIPRGVPAIVGGPPKSAKSICTLDMAISLALGEDWLGVYEVRDPVRTLYLSLEDAHTVTSRRVWQLLRARGAVPGDVEGQLAIDSDHGFHFEQEGYRRALVKAAEEFKPGVIFVDSFARSTSINENSKEDMARVTIPWAELVKETGASVVVVHHFRKSTRDEAGEELDLGRKLRGSGDLYAFVRHVVGLARVYGQPRHLSLETVGNYAYEMEPQILVTDSEDTPEGRVLRVRSKGALDDALDQELEEQIFIQLSREPLHTKPLAKILRRRAVDVRGAVESMEERGLIFRHAPRAPWKVKLLNTP